MNEIIKRQMDAVPYMGTARYTNPHTQLELVLRDYLPNFSIGYDFDTNYLTLWLGDNTNNILLAEQLLSYDPKKFVEREISVLELPELTELIHSGVLKLAERYIQSLESKANKEGS